MRDALAEAERFLHEKIPLTRAMAVRVVPRAEGFAIEAPVAANHNHLQTAFGGSINAVATLAAYTLLWLELRADDAEVLVVDSTIRFLAPVREMISAVCRKPEADLSRRFRSEFTEKGRARIRLHVQVQENEAVAAEFTGTFLACRRPPAA